MLSGTWSRRLSPWKPPHSAARKVLPVRGQMAGAARVMPVPEEVIHVLLKEDPAGNAGVRRRFASGHQKKTVLRQLELPGGKK
ncbi:MAG: hypothetical protein Q4F72_12035 [Desulfovibrionaceae bacterium]|nr:hypothetical protein [Desulfovibrionaceae bacterium]